MFLHYILSQPKESLMKKFFNAQLENSSKTDWTFQVKNYMKELEINLTMEEIHCMSKNMFKEYIRKKIESGALKYLKSQIKSKGKEIEYKEIEMQEYLKPESKLSIKEKQDIFKMRTRMIDIKENMKGNHFNFDCDACKLKGIRRKETQRHVYKCIQLNKRKRTIKYKEIFGSKTAKMKHIIKRMNTNLTKRKHLIKT